jgi:outer membrane protein assembly factor BamB
VWANFGSRGIHCYTVDGEHVWSQDLVEMLTFRAFGEGSSPAIAGDAVIVVSDHEGDSKIYAFDKLTGKPLWSHEREEGTSWSTPLPVEIDGRLQVITSASNFVRSYDVKTGEIVWQCAGLTRGAIPSPVIGHGNVYCMTGYDAFSLLSIRLGGSGDLSNSDAIAWTADHGTPYISSLRGLRHAEHRSGDR